MVAPLLVLVPVFGRHAVFSCCSGGRDNSGGGGRGPRLVALPALPLCRCVCVDLSPLLPDRPKAAPSPSPSPSSSSSLWPREGRARRPRFAARRLGRVELAARRLAALGDHCEEVALAGAQAHAKAVFVVLLPLSLPLSLSLAVALAL